MNVYFACSIRAGREYAHLYLDIVNSIKAAGAEVVSELFADPTIEAAEGTKHKPTDRDLWAADLKLIRAADAVIAEVTNPSLGVGYEIAKAEAWSIPVLALFYDTGERRLSAMINGSAHTKVIRYKKLTEAQSAIATFVQSLTK